MAAVKQSKFAAHIADAADGGTNDYFCRAEDGTHVCEIVGLQLTKPFGKPECLKVDFKITESDNEAVQVGRTKNWYRDTMNELSEKDIKTFMKHLMSITGGNPYDREELVAFINEAISEECPHLGRLVGVRTSTRTTKAGKDFTNLSFYPLEG